VAGTSIGSDNPGIELAFAGRGPEENNYYDLQVYPLEHNPYVDSLHLYGIRFRYEPSWFVHGEEILYAFQGDERYTGDTSFAFNLLVTNGETETVQGQYRITLEEEILAKLERIDSSGAVMRDEDGILHDTMDLERPVYNYRGNIGDSGMALGINRMFLPGTPYLADVDNAGDFTLAKLARGVYRVRGLTASGQLFDLPDKLNTSDTFTASDWRKPDILYTIGTAGMYIAGVDSTNPIIYDNSMFDDTVDDKFLWAKAALGADLRGIIATRDMGKDINGAFNLTVTDALNEASGSVEMARRVGLTNLPDPVAGADTGFTIPSTAKIEDTQIFPNEGSSLIVQEALKASSHKPLLIVVGGPLTTIANAYLSDPSIADRMIVFSTDIFGEFLSNDPWASYIVVKRCKVVNFGRRYWYPEPPEEPALPPERFQTLPKNELIDFIHTLAVKFQDPNSGPPNYGSDHGFGDGAGTHLIFNPLTWKAVRWQQATGVLTFQEVTSQPYDVLDAEECDFNRMREDFFGTFSHPDLFQ
jgi:hypothetical protein